MQIVSKQIEFKHFKKISSVTIKTERGKSDNLGVHHDGGFGGSHIKNNITINIFITHFYNINYIIPKPQNLRVK